MLESGRLARLLHFVDIAAIRKPAYKSTLVLEYNPYSL